MSLRALRFSFSSSSVVEDGNVAEVTTTVPAPDATRTSLIPPGRVATTRASPPPDGSSQSWLLASSSSSTSSSGSGRAEVNSSDPSGRKAAPPSPLALRVSRRAGASPAGSTSQSAVTYFVRLGFSVETAVTNLPPSGESTRPEPRGRSM